MRWCVVALAGCNQVWGLDSTHLPIDAMTSVDEDLDNILNDVDNCPGIYNPAQADRDTDAVGDVCDPHPDTTGDSIVAKAFFSTSQIDLWTPDTAETWTVVGGALVPSIDANATSGFLTLGATAQRPSLEVGYTVLDYGPDSPIGNLFAITLARPSDVGTWRVQDLGSGPFQIIAPAHNGLIEQAEYIDAQGVNTTHTLRCTRDTLSNHCVLDGLAHAGVFGITDTGSVITARMELQSVKLAIRYTIIYAGP